MKDKVKEPTRSEIRLAAKSKGAEVERAIAAIAQHIDEWSAVGKAMNESRLTRRAILVLLRDALPGVSIVDIDKVLDALPDLKRRYLR